MGDISINIFGYTCGIEDSVGLGGLLGDCAGRGHQLGIQLLTGNAVCIEDLVEIPHHLGLQVGSAVKFARNNTLHSLGDLSNNSGFMTRDCDPGTLELLDGDVHLERYVLIYVGFIKFGKASDGEWLLLTDINKIFGASFQKNGVSQDHFDFL
jgi:hypothetical protein